MDQKKEYDDFGLIEQSFTLSDATLIPALLNDYSQHFKDQIAQFKQQNIHRVPYIITPTISKIAHDLSISKVIKEVIGEKEQWVMWGSNIQQGTPNQAYEWHMDFESMYFPAITVMIGLDGCTEKNATTCIPSSHLLKKGPDKEWHQSDPDTIYQMAQNLDSRCGPPKQFKNFGNGKFYVFNAKTWHAGSIDSSKERTLLILHYQKASDPRVPQMKSYSEATWFDYPAPFIVENGFEEMANSELYSTKKKNKLKRFIQKMIGK